MSKVGVVPITVEPAVNVEIDGNRVIVRGKEGQLEITFPKLLTVEKKDNQIFVKRSTNANLAKASHGLFRSILFNAVVGVDKPWEKTLEVVGTGFKVKLQGEDLNFDVGYSHSVVFKKTPGITFQVVGNNRVVVRGADKHLVGQTAHKITLIKKPDPYKGKGIRYLGQYIKLKPGKKAKTVGGAK